MVNQVGFEEHLWGNLNGQRAANMHVHAEGCRGSLGQGSSLQRSLGTWDSAAFVQDGDPAET